VIGWIFDLKNAIEVLPIYSQNYSPKLSEQTNLRFGIMIILGNKSCFCQTKQCCFGHFMWHHLFISCPFDRRIWGQKIHICRTCNYDDGREKLVTWTWKTSNFKRILFGRFLKSWWQPFHLGLNIFCTKIFSIFHAPALKNVNTEISLLRYTCYLRETQNSFFFLCNLPKKFLPLRWTFYSPSNKATFAKLGNSKP